MKDHHEPCGCRPAQHPLHIGDIKYSAKQINELLGMIPHKADRKELLGFKAGFQPDEEDLTAVEVDKTAVVKFKDRDTTKGKGYIILRTEKSLVEQMVQENTIYEVRYDFDLGGETLEVPANCVLDFRGGSFNNGIINGNGTHIQAENYKIFNGISLSGKWNLYDFKAEWYGAVNSSEVDSTLAIQTSINEVHKIGGGVVSLGIGYFLVTDTIYLLDNITLRGTKNTSFSYQDNNYTACTKIVANFSDTNKWVIDTKNIVKSTGLQVDYRTSCTGSSLDNGTISSVSDVAIEDIRISTINNIVFGGVRFQNAPGFKRKNITVQGVYNGFALASAWNGIDESLTAYAKYTGFNYLQDTNSNQVINCIANMENVASGTSIPNSSLMTATVTAMTAVNANNKSVGLVGYYMYGCKIDGFCSERGNIAKIFNNSVGVVDSAYYMEGITDWYYKCISSDISIGKGFYLASDSCKGISLHLGCNVYDEQGICNKEIVMTNNDKYETTIPFYYITSFANYPSFKFAESYGTYFLSEDTSSYPGAGFPADINGVGSAWVMYRKMETYRTLDTYIKSLLPKIRVAAGCVIDIPEDKTVWLTSATSVVGESSTNKAVIRTHPKHIPTFVVQNQKITISNIKFKHDWGPSAELYKSFICCYGNCDIVFNNCEFDLPSYHAYLMENTNSLGSNGIANGSKPCTLNLTFNDCKFTGSGQICSPGIKIVSLTVSNTEISGLSGTYYGFNTVPLIDSRFSKIGTTNARPVLDSSAVGFEYFDTTENKKVIWNGSAWV